MLFEVPRAVPTIGLGLRSRWRVPHDAIERGQDGHGECQHRGDIDYSFCHATTLTTASASAQTPIHSANTAIVPKATRPMPVIASLIGAFPDLSRPYSVPEPAYRLHQRGLRSACIAPLTSTRPTELGTKSFRDFWQQEFACCLDVRHAANPAFKGVKVGQIAKSRRYSSEPHDPSAGWAMRRCWRAFIREFVGHGQMVLKAELSPTPYRVSLR